MQAAPGARHLYETRNRQARPRPGCGARIATTAPARSSSPTSKWNWRSYDRSAWKLPGVNLAQNAGNESSGTLVILCQQSIFQLREHIDQVCVVSLANFDDDLSIL